MSKFIIACVLAASLLTGCADKLEPNSPVLPDAGPVERIAYKGGEQ